MNLSYAPIAVKSALWIQTSIILWTVKVFAMNVS